jgi:hypothetical protein
MVTTLLVLAAVGLVVIVAVVLAAFRVSGRARDEGRSGPVD